VSGSSPASFTVSVKKQAGNVEFSSSCGAQTVAITIR
jgi:hypothetical protein